MGVINNQAIEGYLRKGQLILNPRAGQNGRQFDIENDSYDLSAGTAIWKQPTGNRNEATIETRCYLPESSGDSQPTVTVQPGQMIFVVTREDILMPPDLCGTVYSRNSIALAGILALNTGHVDPGYQGPIAIRLINLRAIPWTLTLGEAIFTITFQTVDRNPLDPPNHDRHYSQEWMIKRVRETANAALSNALYDLYQFDIENRLNDFKVQALEEFRKERDERWVKREELWSTLINTGWKKILAAIIFVAVIAAPIVAVIAIL